MAVNVRRRDGKGHGFGDAARCDRHCLRSRVVEAIGEGLPGAVHRNLADRPVSDPDHHITHLGGGRVNGIRNVHRGELHHRELVVRGCDDRSVLGDAVPDDLVIQLIGADEVSVDCRLKIDPQRMRAVGLHRNHIVLLPAGNRCADRFLLHAVQEEMHRLRHSTVRRVRESQHAGLDGRIVKGTGERKLHHRNGEVLHPAVPVGIRNGQLHGIGAGGEIIADRDGHSALRHVQHRFDAGSDLNGQRAVARGHVVLYGRPCERQRQRRAAGNRPADPC